MGPKSMQRYDITTQRLYVDDELDSDGLIVAGRQQANYLLNVLRMKDGSRVLLFNSRDGEWLGEISVSGRNACNIRLLSQTRPQPRPSDLIYLFAPLKKSRLDYMVQKAVEMGVGILQPVITAHTQVTKLNLQRARANMIEAAEQCGILSIAQILEPVGFAELLETWDDDRLIIFCDEMVEEGDGLDRLSSLKGKKLALLIGPEGGFSDDERLALRSMDCVHAISLGPRILRADTAAVAALAVLQATAGDWNN